MKAKPAETNVYNAAKTQTLDLGPNKCHMILSFPASKTHKVEMALYAKKLKMQEMTHKMAFKDGVILGYD